MVPFYIGKSGRYCHLQCIEFKHIRFFNAVAKFFEAQTAEKIFDQAFISKWLFDVEIFFRMIRLFGRSEIQNHLREIPLRAWVDTPDSRVSPLYFFIYGGIFLKFQKSIKS